MKKQRKQFISLLLAITMVLSLLPAQTFAAADPQMLIYFGNSPNNVDNRITGATIVGYYKSGNNYIQYASTADGNIVDLGDGRYSFPSQSTTSTIRYKFIITAPGYEEHTYTGNMKASSETELKIQMTPDPNATVKPTVQVSVEDSNNNAIPNATVTVQYGATNNPTTNLAADNSQAAQGKFTFESQGNAYYKITVTAPGYKEKVYETGLVNPNNDTVYTITLEEDAPVVEDGPVRVAVINSNGDPVSNATVTVKYGRFQSYISTNVTVDDSRAAYGMFTFESAGTGYYSVTATALGYEDGSYTTSTAVTPTNETVFTVTLTEKAPEYVPFEVFYYLSGNEKMPFPETYDGSGAVENYGPARDDTPAVIINVDISKLQRMPNVTYVELDNGEYKFYPTEMTQTYEPVQKFWESVWECITPESKKDFEATGLSHIFLGYCLKQQSNLTIPGNYPDNHLDGVLVVTPPVYVLEMYEADAYGNETYFAGEAVNKNETGMKIEDLLSFCEEHVGYTITWETDDQGKLIFNNNVYQGIYVDGTHVYNVTLTRKTMTGKELVTHVSGLQYYKMNEQQYLSQYVLKVTQGQSLSDVYTVVYTDGVADEVLYHDQTYVVDPGANVPAFKGENNREDYTFIGWVLENGDGTVLKDAQVQAMQVTSDMVFHAVWYAGAHYQGRVELVLNGTYNSATHVAIGQRIPLETILGADAKLYLLADGEQNKLEEFRNYIPLEPTGETGVYTASLENGNYLIFYSVDNGATKISADDQLMVINNENRTRYLFFNTVNYDLNGGSGGPAELLQYWHSGYGVNVDDTAPTREGYVFAGWKDQDGNLYAPGSLLTEDIDKAYTLTAQWKKDVHATVNVRLEINHATSHGVDPDDWRSVETILMYRLLNSDEPYVEVVDKEIIQNVTFTKKGENPKTIVEMNPFFTNLSVDYAYSAEVVLHDYYVTDEKVTVTEDLDGNVTYDVVLQLQYNPDLFHLEYNVVVDRNIPETLAPVAVDIKVIAYDANKENAWAPITRHIDHSVDINITDYTGGGFYHVPMHREDKTHYYYRVRPVGFTLPDGTELVTEVPIDGGFLPEYLSLEDPSGKYPKGAFYAQVTVTDGKRPDESTGLDGVYASGKVVDGLHQQAGTLTIKIFSNCYHVTFKPNGGTLNGTTDNTTLDHQFIMPDLQNYVPTREGGYVFDGWYLADADGNYLTDADGNIIKAVSNQPLTEDVVLVAKWKDPLVIQGQVTVEGSYLQTNLDGTTTVQVIADADRIKQVVVALQHKDANGYTETMHVQTLNLVYDKDTHIAIDSYRFEGVHDEDHEHRILILAPNYGALYQNEPESLDQNNVLNPGAYDEESFFAEDENGDKIEVVNAYLTFNPDSFDLQYTVDASQIGHGFRPDCAEVLVTYDGDPLITIPHKWPVISQMIFGNENRGNHTELGVLGMGSGTETVWKSRADGVTLYDYAIRVEMTSLKGLETEYDEATSPFTVEYKAPAYYTANGQSQMLTATLIPKQYPIVYVLNGGTLTDACPTSHTWSHATDLSNAIPVQQGMAFAGWYLDEACEIAAVDVIDAGTATTTTLYAKWVDATDRVTLHLTIVHNNAGNEATLYDNPLVVKLLSKQEGTTDYTLVPEYARSYAPQYWHIMPNGTDTEICVIAPVFTELSKDYDYSLNVSILGYYLDKPVEVTEKEENGGTTYEVRAVLKFDPQLRKTVIFHTNLDKQPDLFRTYVSERSEGDYHLTANNTIPVTYDLPVFDMAVHNDYIFKGWYLDKDNNNDSNPIFFDGAANATVFTTTTDVYAHWIEVGEVAKNPEDGKNYADKYQGFDLVGAQIRKDNTNQSQSPSYHGTAGAGLRFVAVLSSDVYKKVEDLSAKNPIAAGATASMEYGFVVATKSATDKRAVNYDQYALEYKGMVNGVDTTTDYGYAVNMVCSGPTIIDHYYYEGENENGENGYRLFTAVITYKGSNAETQKGREFVARAYLRYNDANGLYRTYYNNYGGTNVYGGVCISYNGALALMEQSK